MGLTVTENVAVVVRPGDAKISVYDSATITESVTTPAVSLAGISVYDSATVTENVARNLVCLIEPRTTAGATFGLTTKEASFTKSANYIQGCKYQSGAAGELVSISTYIQNLSGGTANVKCAIYDSSFNLLTNGTTEEKALAQAYDALTTFNFTTAPDVSASTYYYLCIWNDRNLYCYRKSGATDQYFYESLTYGSWPASFSPDGTGDYEVSIYATYEETTSGSVESVTVSESVARKVISFIDVYDSANVTDVDAVQVRAFFSPFVYDNVTVTESIATAGVSYLNVNDTITASEYIKTVASLGDISVSDNAVVTEYIKSKLTSFIAESETVTISESIAMLRSFPGISVYDAITITEKIWGNMWQERSKETDAWTERTKEIDTWTERTKEDDEWTERPHKEGA